MSFVRAVFWGTCGETKDMLKKWGGKSVRERDKGGKSKPLFVLIVYKHMEQS